MARMRVRLRATLPALLVCALAAACSQGGAFVVRADGDDEGGGDDHGHDHRDSVQKPSSPLQSVDPHILPRCGPELAKLRLGSEDCLSHFLSEGEFLCPSYCCCEHHSTNTNTTHSFGTVGSCSISFVRDSTPDDGIRWMHPFSVSSVGGDELCGDYVDDLCKDVGQGCIFGELAAAAESPDSPVPQDASGSQEAETTAGRTRKIALAVVSTGIFVVLLSAAVVYFILVPWLRGNLNEPSMTSLDDPALGIPAECEPGIVDANGGHDTSQSTTNYGDYTP